MSSQQRGGGGGWRGAGGGGYGGGGGHYRGGGGERGGPRGGRGGGPRGGSGARGPTPQYQQRQQQQQHPAAGSGSQRRAEPSPRQPVSLPQQYQQTDIRESGEVAAPLPRREFSSPPPKPPATEVQKRNGICSIWTINVEPGRKAYHYDVDIQRLPMPVRRRNGHVEMDKGRQLVKGADDGQKALHRNLCYELFAVAYKKTGALGMPNGHQLVYNNRATLYTSVPIEDVNVDIENSETNDYVKTYCGKGDEVRFNLTITRNASSPELDLNDLEQYTSGQSVFNENRILRTFFEMATTQYALNKDLYVPIGPGRLFESDSNSEAFRERAGKGIVLRSGLAKGVRVIRNDGRTPKAAVVIDTKVSAFFERKPLIETALDILPQQRERRPAASSFSPSDFRELEKMLEDVRVEVNYNQVRTFELGRLGDKPIKDIFIDVDGERLSIPEYYKRRYNITLKWTDFPGISPNNPVPPGKKPELFPLEVLTVMEDQRVPREKIERTPGLTDRLLNYNSTPPRQRMEQIWDRARSLGLFNDANAVLRAFGIKVDQKSNRIVIGVRQLPQLQFGRRRMLRPDLQKGEWRRDAARCEYLAVHELNNWIVLCARQRRRDVDEFVHRLCQMGQDKGIPMAQPQIVDFHSPDNPRDADQTWLEEFKKYAVERIQFIMLVDEKRKDTHGLLKVCEALYKITTQHVTMEKAMDVVRKNQRVTLENILNKLNCKNFGLNYQPEMEPAGKRFALESGQVLVIGYDVAHPAPMSARQRRMCQQNEEDKQMSSLEPSVVGICSNMAPNPHNFVGDYFYQEARREALDMGQLAERTRWILRNLEMNRPRQARPKYIFLIRDGISEGQASMAYSDELEAVKHGCKMHDPNYDPKFVMIVGSKKHSKKFFFENENGGGRYFAENLVPGSVIQTQVVRADLTEMFLQAHSPIKGTGKPVEYNVLEDEIDISQDEIQSMLMCLSYSHQIVNVAISLTEPVYQADALAKRGRNNFLALKKFMPDHFNGCLIERNGYSRINNAATTNMLSYWGNGTQKLAHRFTA